MSDSAPDLRRGERRPRMIAVPDRLPPSSPESEQTVLGCAFLDPNAVIPLCIEKLRPEAMYDLRNKTVYETMLELWDERAPVTTISVYERLQSWGQAEQVGGLAYISSLPDIAPSAAGVEYFIGIVRDNWLLRQMIHVCTNAVSSIYEHEGDVGELLDTVERDVLRVAEHRTINTTPTITELVRDTIHDFEQWQLNRGQLTGLDTGFIDLNSYTNGLQAGEMIVLAARPSYGKTSLAMNIADHVAVELNIPVGVFSLEMTARQLTHRLVSARARVNLRDVREGRISAEDYPRITAASSRIAQAPLYIDDTAGLSVMQVRSKARRWHQQYGIRLLVVDYLQLMNALGGKRKFESKQEEVADISSGIKNLAKELNIPVIAICQLNREVEKDKGRKPRLSDLRNSGAIEQDADIVGFLYRCGKQTNDEGEDSQFESSVPVNLLLAKNRNGIAGQDVRFTFLKCFTKFESAARVSQEDDVPPEAQQQESLPYPDA